MSRKPDSSGFSMLEVLIALVVLAGGLMAVIKFQATVTAESTLSKERSEAALLAQAKMEELRGYLDQAGFDDYSSDTTGEALNGETSTYTRSWQVDDIVDTLHGRYAVINVDVAWTDRDDQLQKVALHSVVAYTDPHDAVKLASGGSAGSGGHAGGSVGDDEDDSGTGGGEDPGGGGGGGTPPGDGGETGGGTGGETPTSCAKTLEHIFTASTGSGKDKAIASVKYAIGSGTKTACSFNNGQNRATCNIPTTAHGASIMLYAYDKDGDLVQTSPLFTHDCSA